MEELLKIIGALVATFGLFKVVADVSHARSSRRRENYKLIVKEGQTTVFIIVDR